MTKYIHCAGVFLSCCGLCETAAVTVAVAAVSAGCSVVLVLCLLAAVAVAATVAAVWDRHPVTRLARKGQAKQELDIIFVVSGIVQTAPLLG